MPPPAPNLGACPRSTQAYVVAALVGLLLAAALPSLVQFRRSSGETEFERVRTRLARAVGEVHRVWMLSESRPGRVAHGGREIAINENGWPALRLDDAGKPDAREFYRRLVPDEVLGPEWEAYGAAGAPVAIFHLRVPGGGSFRYDADTGRISDRSPPNLTAPHLIQRD